ncbi:MAG: hypothetical protein Q4G51_06995 [Dermatophilus congolensis]|nr:hypothetical protein [Dermatophilus congolensis]
MNVLGRGGRNRTIAVAAIALSAFGLAGCGAGTGPGVAAVSQGVVVTEKQVDDVMADFERAGAAGQIQRGAVVAMLAMRPVILEVGKSSGAVIGEDAIRASLAQQLPGASEATVQFQQTQATGGAMNEAALGEFEKAMQSADINISPRYGTYDPQKGFAPSAPNWLSTAPGGAEGLPPGHP